jgi:hypothetical protein
MCSTHGYDTWIGRADVIAVEEPMIEAVAIVLISCNANGISIGIPVDACVWNGVTSI